MPRSTSQPSPHMVSAQVSPVHVPSQAHTSGPTHLPCPEQLDRQICWSHPAPVKPLSQWHRPWAHMPCPVQLPGQPPRTPEQSSPKKPTSHVHEKAADAPLALTLAVHSPWPEQLRGQPRPSTLSTSAQSLPPKPGSASLIPVTQRRPRRFLAT